MWSTHLEEHKGKTEKGSLWVMNKDLTHKDKHGNMQASLGKYSELTDRA